MLNGGIQLSTKPGGAPIVGYRVERRDPETGAWTALFTTPGDWTGIEVDSANEDCGAFRIAAISRVGVGQLSRVVEDCRPT